MVTQYWGVPESEELKPAAGRVERLDRRFLLHPLVPEGDHAKHLPDRSRS
jgi:hypothetical protein